MKTYNVGLKTIARNSFISGSIEKVRKAGSAVITLKAGKNTISVQDFVACLHRAGIFTKTTGNTILCAIKKIEKEVA